MSPDSPIVMHWDCRRQGCFNVKKRLKFHVFKPCLPGKVSFSDVDGIVEINGNLLLLEWKDHAELPIGQRLLFERLTRFCPATVFVVDGDAELMTVRSIATVWCGRLLPPEVGDLDRLRHEIQAWAQWALANPVLSRKPRG